MRITIDTKEDSPEDIRKAIELLHSLANKSGYTPKSRNIFEDSSSFGLGSSSEPSVSSSPSPSPSSAPSSGFFNMFGDSSPSTLSSPSTTQTLLVPEPEKKLERPEIMTY